MNSCLGDIWKKSMFYISALWIESNRLDIEYISTKPVE